MDVKVKSDGLGAIYLSKTPSKAEHTDAVKSAESTQRDNHGGKEAVPIQSKMTETQMERIVELLKDYNMKSTQENIDMLKSMVENGIPLTKAHIQKMNQAMKLTQDQQQALFLIQNNMNLTKANVLQLKELASGQFKITDQISNLLNAIDGMADKALAAQLKQILSSINQGQSEGQATNTENTQTITQGTPATQPQMMQQISQPVNQPQSLTTATLPNTPPENAQNLQQQTQQPAQTTPSPETQPQSNTIYTKPESTQTSQQQTPQGMPSTQTQTLQPQTFQQPTTQSQAPPATTQSTLPPMQTTTIQPNIQPENTQQLQPPAISDENLQAAQQSPQSTQQAASQNRKTTQTAQQSPTLPQNLTFNPLENTPQNIDHFINNLRTALTQIQQQTQNVQDTASADVSRVLQEAQTLESHIEFTAQIRDQIFVQLPIYIGGQQTQSSLHIYKDGKKSTHGGGSGETSSALIALETAGMGHFETYVQKKASAVHCQFRLESNRIAKLVRDNIHALNALLKNHNYTLESFTFLPPSEPYTLLDNPSKFNQDYIDEMSLDNETLHYNREV